MSVDSLRSEHQRLCAEIVALKFERDARRGEIDILNSDLLKKREQLKKYSSRLEEYASPYHPSLSLIKRAACRMYGISMADLMSHRRTKQLAHARQVALYVAKTVTLRSLPEIGKSFDRDHTTTLHAVRKIARLREVDVGVDLEINKIIEAVLPEYNA